MWLMGTVMTDDVGTTVGFPSSIPDFAPERDAQWLRALLINPLPPTGPSPTALIRNTPLMYVRGDICWLEIEGAILPPPLGLKPSHACVILLTGSKCRVLSGHW